MSKSSTITETAGDPAVATPDRVTTHPGEVLVEEFLLPLGISAHALAMSLRVPATRIGAIVKEERGVTADTALRLARFFGTSAEFWIKLQAMHDLTKARREKGAEIARDVHPARAEGMSGLGGVVRGPESSPAARVDREGSVARSDARRRAGGPIIGAAGQGGKEYADER